MRRLLLTRPWGGMMPCASSIEVDGFLRFCCVPASPQGTTVKIRFGDCFLDTDMRRLFRGAEAVHLSPKAFDLLTALVANRDRALSKSRLMELIWPGVSVSGTSLARVVREVREAVGDLAHPARIVRTVH